MSTRRLQTTEGALAIFGAGLLMAGSFSALLYFGFGIDLHALGGFGIPCVFRAVTGFSCPGCGMTRALWLASQMQWMAALRMNPLIAPLLGFAVYSSLGLLRRKERATQLSVP